MIQGATEIFFLCMLMHSNKFSIVPQSIETLAKFRHTFSHFHLEITPLLVKADNISMQTMDAETMMWYHPRHKQTIGLPQPIKRLLEKVIS